MNLIEQLGGIEKAREIVESSYKNAFFEYEDGLFVSVEDLRIAIASHDEDHCEHEWNNLTSNGDKYIFLVCKHCDSTQKYLPLDDSRKFEVGDAVVLSRYSGDFAKANDALYVIFDFENALETLAVLSDQKGGEVRSGTEHLIHATPAEIAAGHRL